MEFDLEKFSGQEIDFNGTTLRDEAIIIKCNDKHPDVRGITLKNFTLMHNYLILLDCSQCKIENATFINSGIRVRNINHWSENNRFRDLCFHACQDAIIWEKGEKFESCMRQTVDGIFLSNCVRGLVTHNGSLRGSIFNNIVGNFGLLSQYAMSLGGNMRGCTINHLNFEDGNENTKLFQVEKFEHEFMKPFMPTNYFYHGHEDQIGLELL